MKFLKNYLLPIICFENYGGRDSSIPKYPDLSRGSHENLCAQTNEGFTISHTREISKIF